MENVYCDFYERTHKITEVRERFKILISEEAIVSVAGRVILKRKMGKMMFFNIADSEGSIQIFADVAGLGKDQFKMLSNEMKVGFIVGASGKLFFTKTGEKTINAGSLKILTSAQKPLPEKFHGLNDIETRYRQRYLDLIANSETRDVFRKRSQIVKFVRQFLESHDFCEVETPIFQRNPCGASANPFITHHDAKDVDLYLRISPETFLKQLIVGGMDRVYEIGKNFRNEGIDVSHLQEFTMLEWYASYWNYESNIDFTKRLLTHVVKSIFGTTKVSYQDDIFDFSVWQTVSYRDLVLSDCGIDVLAFSDAPKLLSAIVEKNINLDGIDDNISLGVLIDKLYKKVSRPKLIKPTILMNHPAALIPLARRNDVNNLLVDSFQVLVNGWEIAKGYSELADPKLQRKLLEEQSSSRLAGDKEAMFLDDDFLLALEYGMPPVSGVGIGIDRLTSILTNQRNLNDVIFFPLMR
jgi:lysyl-tRNA synthetase class 2